MSKYLVITDDDRIKFDDHDTAYKFYCDNIDNNNYIEFVELRGIVGLTLLYHTKEFE